MTYGAWGRPGLHAVKCTYGSQIRRFGTSGLALPSRNVDPFTIFIFSKPCGGEIDKIIAIAIIGR
jgi:hypothetical protein